MSELHESLWIQAYHQHRCNKIILLSPVFFLSNFKVYFAFLIYSYVSPGTGTRVHIRVPAPSCGVLLHGAFDHVRDGQITDPMVQEQAHCQFRWLQEITGGQGTARGSCLES